SACHYLKGTELEYMLSYELLVASSFTLDHIFCVCYDWVNQPYKLFRAYSIYHLHDLLSAVAQEKASTTISTT
ncbi:hypothetical protein J3458_012272, partial [Metarhizium acridum]|uniref:uncharacterized protein n=1 Tax=Metarhizium acridum TaxID=92637 RepID=UPI001C6B818C